MDLIQSLKDKITAQGLWSNEFVVRRNDYLLKAGAIEKYIYFIEEGTIRAFITEGEEEYVIRFGYKNSIITALDSFFSGHPTHLTLQAIKQCRIKSVSKNAFDAFIDSSKENAQLYRIILEQLVIQQMEREIDILTTSPALRYQRVLKRSPQLFQEIPHKYIASYLRMTPETLSRLKKY